MSCHLVPDSITKHRTVLTTKPTTIYAILGNTLATFFIFLPMFCSNKKLVANAALNYTLPHCDGLKHCSINFIVHSFFRL